MQRRALLTLVASVLGTPAAGGIALAQESVGDGDSGDQGQEVSLSIEAALQQFLALPGTKSYMISAGQGGSLGRISYQPDLVLFTASAFKTFVLGQYLRDVEADRLSEDEQLAIDDSVRDVGSPVFLNLSGTVQARSVLDAMIAYSDNTATNRALGKVGADQVRALIAQAGLSAIRIPDSVRLFGSYILGAPAGVDLGWPGILEASESPPGPLRPLLNEVMTLAGSARDFVSWYEQALAGAFFAKPETLTEFKRIQATSVQIPVVVPPNTLAYGKGGEAPDVNGLSAKSFAGQMIVVNGQVQTPVTFCFLVNWNGSASGFPAVQDAYFAAIKSILTIIKQEVGGNCRPG